MFKNNKLNKGFSLIDSILGIAIISIVFFGIFGVFRLGIIVLSNNKARVGAVSLANEQMEFMRSLSYDSVGTQGGIPSGNILQNETISLNNINYNRRTLVQYIDDEKDGFGVSDENGITADYKRVKIEVSWFDKNTVKKTYLISNIVPKGIETLSGGGTLIVNVFNSLGIPIQGAKVHIENNDVLPAISLDVFTNLDGKIIFPGSPSANNYEVTVTKVGYSTSKTYGVDVLNVNPFPGHLSVLAGNLTTISFPIDILSSKTVRTFSAIESDFWEDSFVDMSKISTSTNITVESNELKLAFATTSEYEISGSVFSLAISPSYLDSWTNISWNDLNTVNTEIRYGVYYLNAPNSYILIPDLDLPNNSLGFVSSPIDISVLNSSVYDDIKIKASLITSSILETPILFDWKVDYKKGPIPLPNVDFLMEGDKIIGSDSVGNPIKKYSQNLQTDGNGEVVISPLEWDNYTVTIDSGSTGLDISESCLPQPYSLNPGVTVVTDITLSPHTTNSFLVFVSDNLGNPLENATTRLYRTGVDIIKTTSSCGQVFFEGLASGTVSSGNPYSLDVDLSGFIFSTETDIDISGTTKNNITLSN